MHIYFFTECMDSLWIHFRFDVFICHMSIACFPVTVVLIWLIPAYTLITDYIDKIEKLCIANTVWNKQAEVWIKL